MYRYIVLFFYIMLITDTVLAQKAKLPHVEWTLASELIDKEGNRSLGFAGAISAVDNDALIVAGGANFPDKMPWDGGKKYYADEIQVLQKSGKGFVWNRIVKAKLPEPIAYCGYTSTPKGIVYAGGENNEGLSNRAYLLKWDNFKDCITIKLLPNLPIAVTNVALTSVGNMVYLVGGDLEKRSSKLFLSIDLSIEAPSWERLPDVPIALANTVLAVQKNKTGKAIYVIGGRSKTAWGISDLHHTTFVYDLENQYWKEAAAISDGKNITNFSAGAGVAFGDQYILIVGGDDGKTFHKIENYLSRIANSKDEGIKERLIREKNELNTNHNGFYKGILLYNTIRNTWIKIGELPFLAQVTTTASIWDGKIVLSNGEVKPGVRTPNIMLGTIK